MTEMIYSNDGTITGNLWWIRTAAKFHLTLTRVKASTQSNTGAWWGNSKTGGKETQRQRRPRRRWNKNKGAKLPHAVLPVNSHIHLVDTALRNRSRWNQQAHACRGTTGNTDWTQAEIMRLIKGFMMAVVLHRVLLQSKSQVFPGSVLLGVTHIRSCMQKVASERTLRQSILPCCVH